MKLRDNKKNIMQNTITKAEQKVLTSRYIPEGYRIAQGITNTTQVFFKDYGERYIALIFLGRAVKPTYHTYFKTPEARQAYVDSILNTYQERLRNVAKRKAEQKAKRAEGHNIKVGDIFRASWGYEQTNVNFYQVVELVGKQSVKVREIASKSVEDHTTYSNVVAVKDAFLSNSHLCGYKGNDPVLKRVNTNYSNSIKVFEFSNAYLWDGKPCYETNPMFGH